MTPDELEQVLEIVAKADGLATARAMLLTAFGPKPKHRPPKVPLERVREMAEQAIQWYAQNGGKRGFIAADADDEHGDDIARNDDERNALARFLATDKDCQRRLHELDGNGRFLRTRKSNRRVVRPGCPPALKTIASP